jgi:hypothetical protein
MSARALLRPDLDRLAAELRRRGVHVDVAMLRALRDFGLACFDAGYTHAHNARTIPVPAEGPEYSADDVAEVTGRYATHHPHASQVRPSIPPPPNKDRTG